MPTHTLTDSDRALIRAAIQQAEARTSGEIVPYIVGRSGQYEVAVWRAAAGGAILTAALALATAWGYEGWSLAWLYTGWGMATVMALGGTVGALAAAFVEPLRRRLAGADLIDETVHRRAAEAFVAEEVFNTRERTGILLFVSLFEHRIVVLGDSGINAKVAAEEWIEVVDLVRAGIRAKTLAAGLADAIGRCGELLERRGVEIRADDTDELSDDVRFEAT
jgi:putative membrane protein